MYNDSIKVANKIISAEDLMDIFQSMSEEIMACEKKYREEMIKNEKYERQYQNWTVKDYSGSIKVDVNFFDDTSISFDKYNNFISIFNSRLHEIKCFHLRYNCNYSRKLQGGENKYIMDHINMDVYQDKMNIDVKISSDDNIMKDVYELIKQKVLSAPEKYDRIIRNKTSIYNKIGFAIGFIPTCIILLILMFLPVVRQVYATTYIGFSILCIIFSYILGSTIIGGKLDYLYKGISPSKKYVGYDTRNSKSIYKDDIQQYVNSSEILIGKNIDNLKKRKEIIKLEEKYSGYLKYEIMILIILSFIVILIGKII